MLETPACLLQKKHHRSASSSPSRIPSPTFLLGWPQTFQVQEGSAEDSERKRLCFILKCLCNGCICGRGNHGKETTLSYKQSWSGAARRLFPWSPRIGRAGRGHVTLSVPFCNAENKCGPLLQIENFVTLDVTCSLAVEPEQCHHLCAWLTVAQ